MKITFFVKIILLLTILTIVPLLVVSISVMYDFSHMEQFSSREMKDGIGQLIGSSNKSLETLGEKIIKNQALTTKKLVELYLETHPDKTAAELIADPEFQSIAIQPVGEKGYTTVIQTKTQNMIAHPNKAMMGKDLLDMKDKLEMKDWWRVVEPTWRDNADSFGYYEWPEADGTYSKKYMYLAVIGRKLGGDTELSVAATTYINEFNAPVKMLEEQKSETENAMTQNLNKTSKNIQYKFFILITAMLGVVILTGVFFASSITKPIKKLKKFAQKITEGNFKEATVDINSNNEFFDLANCFNTMAGDLDSSRQKLEESNKELENRVESRTKELQEKNEELEKFNKIAVDREMKMVELKEKIKTLGGDEKSIQPPDG